MTSDRPFRILCVNGGGSLGIMPATLLQHLEQQTGKPLSESFDLICGTSVGSLLGAVIGSPRNIHITDAINKLKDTKMFKSSFLRNVATLGGILQPRIPTNIRDAELADLFGDAKLGECKPHVLTVSYDIKAGRAKTFSTLRDPDVYLTDAVKASASVPTVWKPHVVGDAVCLDGGLFSNNPTLYGITEALTTYGKDPEDLVVFSLGTGYLMGQGKSADVKLSGFRLIDRLVRTFASSNTINSVALTSSLVNNMDRFVHLDYPLNLTDFRFISTKSSFMDRLQQVAAKVITENEDVLQEFGRVLTGDHDGRLGAERPSHIARYFNNVRY